MTDKGGCYCGAIRYELSGKAELQLFCFCEDCRKFCSTDGYAGYMVLDEHFTHLQGEPTRHSKVSAEGRTVVRHFCRDCGCLVWGATELGLTSIAAGTLEDPTLFQPTMNVFVEQAPPWARIPSYD